MATDDDEPVPERLARLFKIWETQAARAQDVTAAELSPEDPSLAADLDDLIQAARAAGSIAPTTHGPDASLPHPATITDVRRLDGEPGESSSGADPAPASPLPSVPGYEFRRELGRGGMGVVYLALDLKLNRQVAIKMIAPGYQGGAQAERGFLREAELAARFRHPNIVQIYDFGSAGDRSYFVQEYLTGGTLSERWGKVPQPPREVAGLMRTIAAAVHAAHIRGVIHRDLKPQNILLDADGTPKIADFGLARVIDGGQTLTGLGAGTPEYMAPEQARGDARKVGPRSDVYALGCVLHRGLTGRPPLRGDTPWETVRMVLEPESIPTAHLGPSIPRDLASICWKCLQKTPEDRYETAGDLAEDLRRFLDGEPVRARPIGILRRVGRWMRRPHRLRNAADLGIGYATIGISWSLFAVALIGVVYHPRRPGELILMLGLITALDYLPTIWLGVQIKRRRAWAFPTALALGVTRLALQVLCLIGYSPSFGGVYDDPVARTAVYMFLVVMATTILAAHIAAVPAYLAEREAQGSP